MKKKTNKIKMQAMKIEDMGKILEKKQKKITIIEKNYKKQIEVLKNNFGFKGDVNILLDGNENTKEFFEAKKIKEACQNSSLNKKKEYYRHFHQQADKTCYRTCLIIRFIRQKLLSDILSKRY